MLGVGALGHLLQGRSVLGGSRALPPIGGQGGCVVEAVGEVHDYSRECATQLLQSLNTAAVRSQVIKNFDEFLDFVTRLGNPFLLQCEGKGAQRRRGEVMRGVCCMRHASGEEGSDMV